MYYKTINAKRPSGRKFKLIINKIEREGKPAYFAEAVYREMAFYVSVNKQGSITLNAQ